MHAVPMWPPMLVIILSGVLPMSKGNSVSYLQATDDPAVASVRHKLQTEERHRLWNKRRLECPICAELLLGILETAPLSLPRV